MTNFHDMTEPQDGNFETMTEQAGKIPQATAAVMEPRAADGMDAAAMASAAAEASGLLRLLANPNRLMILCFLLEGERSVGQMEEMLGIRQPTLSQQIAILREARLIGQSRRQAKVVFYQLRDPKVVPVIRALYGVFCAGTVPAAPTPGAAQGLSVAGTDSVFGSLAASPAASSGSILSNSAPTDCGFMAIVDDT